MTSQAPNPAPLEEPARSAMLEALQTLEEQSRSTPTVSRNPARLPLASISLEPEAFNVRTDHDEQHLGQLVRSLATVPDLGPVLVLRCGERIVLVDGHYRMEAYRVQRRPDIPVEFFAGTAREAHLEAVSRAAKATCQMDSRGRQDCAWRLVNAGFTRPQIMSASGVSRAQVSVMRKTLAALGNDAAGITEWWRARRSAEGRIVPLSEEEAKAMVDAQGQLYADRLRKEFGSTLSRNPEIAARALTIHFGRKTRELVLFLKESLSPEEQEWIANEEDSDFY